MGRQVQGMDQSAIGTGQTVIAFDGKPVGTDRLVQASKLAQCIAQIAVHHCIARIDFSSGL